MGNTVEDESEEEKIELTRKELEEIIDKRVEEKLKEERQEQKEDSQNQRDEISRRAFLKRLGTGALGVGALSLIPSASALNVRSDGLSFYGGSGSGLDFDINNSGDVKIPNGDLDLSGNKLFLNTNSTRLERFSGSPDGAQFIDTRTGSEFYFKLGGTTSSEQVLKLIEGGNVDIPNGNLNFAGSNNIQDAGTDAIQFDGSQNVTLPNGDIDLSSGDKMSLPQRSSDPSASAGDMWYRTDLD